MSEILEEDRTYEPMIIDLYFETMKKHLLAIAAGNMSIKHAQEVCRDAAGLIDRIYNIQVKTETDGSAIDGAHREAIQTCIERNEREQILDKVRMNPEQFFATKAFQLNAMCPLYTEKTLYVFNLKGLKPNV